MIRNFSAVYLGAVILPVLAAQESAVTREGGYWVQSIAGAGVIAQPRMQVRTNGDVTVSGAAKSGYSYVLKLRVKSSNEKQARALLSAMRISTAVRGDVFVLTGPVDNSASEMRLQVPRSVKEVTMATSGGGVDLSNLNGALRAETG